MNFRRLIKGDLTAFSISPREWMKRVKSRNDWRYLVAEGKNWNAIDRVVLYQRAGTG
jgi:hypothetical protein